MNELDMPGDGNSDWDKWLHAQEQVEIAIGAVRPQWTVTTSHDKSFDAVVK